MSQIRFEKLAVPTLDQHELHTDESARHPLVGAPTRSMPPVRCEAQEACICNRDRSCQTVLFSPLLFATPSESIANNKRTRLRNSTRASSTHKAPTGSGDFSDFKVLGRLSMSLKSVENMPRLAFYGGGRQFEYSSSTFSARHASGLMAISQFNSGTARQRSGRTA